MRQLQNIKLKATGIRKLYILKLTRKYTVNCSMKVIQNEEKGISESSEVQNLPEEHGDGLPYGLTSVTFTVSNRNVCLLIFIEALLQPCNSSVCPKK